jgi:putative salt-induced outer membrane protein YdiY
MDDGQVYRDKNITVTEDSLVVTNEAMEQVKISIEDFNKVNPDPWELGDGYNFFGDVKAALLLEGGNSDNEELDFSYAMTWRSLKDRYSSKGWWEFDEANDLRNKNKWRSVNKYDRFREGDPDNYYGALIAVEGDEFANIEVRTYMGPYIGRTFFDSPILELEGEVGLVYVYEAYEIPIDEEGTDDYDYPGGNWGLRITSDWVSGYLGDGSTLYIDHDGIANFDDITP